MRGAGENGSASNGKEQGSEVMFRWFSPKRIGASGSKVKGFESSIEFIRYCREIYFIFKIVHFMVHYTGKDTNDANESKAPEKSEYVFLTRDI